MTNLSIYLLGAPLIELDDKFMSIRRSKALALLIYLAMNGRHQRRDTLAALLWPDSAQSVARSSLRRELSLLKKIIGGDWLEIERETLSLKSNAWLDVAQFQQDLADNADDPDLLIKAVNLYRDDFLTGFTLPNCLEFDEWQFFQTEHLRQQFTFALERLIGLLEQKHDEAATIPYVQRRLALDTLHEPSHHRLMTLYMRTGQPTAALRQYQLCRQTLADELGISPSPETIELYEQIRQGTWTPSVDKQASGSNLETKQSNLPLQATPFVGREDELSVLDNLLIAENSRLVTIVGAGGMGKTRLAVACAERQLAHNHFADGVIFVSLASLSTAEHIIPALAEALDFQLDSDRHKRTPQQQILDYLRQKQMLLVMDNFEHLLEGIEILVAILQAASNVQILVTSRQRLNLHEEQLFTIQGLAFPDEKTTENRASAEQGVEYSAIQLFIQSARRLQHDFALAAVDLPHLAHICQLVEGMPLAIELAAAWVETLSLTDIAAEIQQSLDLLATDLHNIPARHRSIRAVFATSWQRLTQSEQELLAQCSIFRGGFTRQAVQFITDASLPGLSKLTSKSLLQYDKGRNRYQIHELLRQYSAERLAHDAERETAVHHRHNNYYTQLLSHYEARLKSDQQFTALAEIEADIENYRLGWAWAVQHSHLEYIDLALPVLCLFYELTVRYQEGEDACRAALSLLDESEATQLQVRALTWQAKFNYLQGQSDRASQQLECGLALLNSPALATQDTRPERAAILLGLGQLGSMALDHHSQIQHYEQSLALYEALDDGWGTSKVLTALCWVVRHQIDVNTAEQWQQQLARGEQLAQRTVTLCRQIGDRAGQANALIQLAALTTYRARDAEALATIEASIELCTALSLKGPLVEANVWRGMIFAAQGQYDQARASLQAAHDLAQNLGYYHQISNCLRVLGVIALGEGRFHEARRWSLSSVATYRASGNHHYLGIAVAVLGLAELHLGNTDSAKQHLIEALRLAIQIRSYIPLWPGLALAALMLVHQGRLIRAVEICHLNLHFMGGAFRRFNEDSFAGHVASATAVLSPQEIAAAQKRGQNLDLWATVEMLLAEFTH